MRDVISSNTHPAALIAFPVFFRISCFCFDVAFDIKYHAVPTVAPSVTPRTIVFIRICIFTILLL